MFFHFRKQRKRAKGVVPFLLFLSFFSSLLHWAIEKQYAMLQKNFNSLVSCHLRNSIFSCLRPIIIAATCSSCPYFPRVSVHPTQCTVNNYSPNKKLRLCGIFLAGFPVSNKQVQSAIMLEDMGAHLTLFSKTL